MTREEAIKTLKEHKIMFQHDFGWDISTIKALDIAISALSENKREFDGMTNGEVIQAVFPNAVIRNDDPMLIKEVLFSSEMWNAPYKAESEDI